MTKYLKMCSPECSIKHAVEIMRDLNCGVVPVVDDNMELVGIVTDRDISLYAAFKDKKPSEIKISEFMTKNVITCNLEDKIDVAIEKMKNNKIRRIPVIDEQKKIAGIISLGDIAVLSGKNEKTFEAFEAISSPVSSMK